jgi:meiosis-specific protein
MIKRLTHHISSMDSLPREQSYLLLYVTRCKQLLGRKFVTFKLVYYDHVPDDYEPPHFKRGNDEKDRFFFATHAPEQIPEKFSIGKFYTPWHEWVSHSACL